MKKTLYSTTALAAAGLLTLGASDAFAQAAAPAAPEKLKMAIGGFFTAYAGFATNSTNNGAAGGPASYHNFDVKNDSEISFKGSVALDNGMKVSLQVEFETDPATAGGTTTNGNTASQVGLDESWLSLDTNGFGELRIGNQKLSTLSTTVGSVTAGGLNPANGDTSLWIVRPSNGMTVGSAFGLPGGADQNRINYISPTVVGTKLAFGYTPSTTETDALPVGGGSTGTETSIWDVAVQTSQTLGDFTIRASVGYLNNAGTQSSSSENIPMGLDVKYGDFTLGGQFVHQWQSGLKGGVALTDNTNSSNQDSWNAGLLYNPGPYRVALRTTQTSSDGQKNIKGQDKAIMYKVAGNYVLGPGVELTGDVIRMEWRDEGNVASQENKGWAVIGGIAVTF